MSATTAADPTLETVPHLKTWGFIGQHTLERCEDPGCRVGYDGRADCGRAACPACGFSGSNLAVPDALEGLMRCTCGSIFEASLARRAA